MAEWLFGGLHDRSQPVWVEPLHSQIKLISLVPYDMCINIGLHIIFLYRYFTVIGGGKDLNPVEMESQRGEYVLAHNGWVMNADPLINFAAEGSQVKLNHVLEQHTYTHTHTPTHTKGVYSENVV